MLYKQYDSQEILNFFNIYIMLYFNFTCIHCFLTLLASMRLKNIYIYIFLNNSYTNTPHANKKHRKKTIKNTYTEEHTLHTHGKYIFI